MKIRQMEIYGVPSPVVDLWETHYGESLLPLQERAVKEYGLLEGRNLVVMGATSSGKTLIGEMAAIRKAARKEKTLYIVPLKSLAEEKYRQFRKVYGEYGIKTIISHRDRQEYDKDILKGSYDIAILVYEKLQGLLVRNPDMLREVRLLVVDELQMVGDEERGSDLEILLTQIVQEAQAREKEGFPPMQILGLSAVLGNPEEMAGWLNSDLLIHSERPVELRRGVLCGTMFQFHESNRGKVGHEFFVSKKGIEPPDVSAQPLPLNGQPDPYHADQILWAARYLAEEQNEPTLVFVPTRWMSRHWAQVATESSLLPPAENTLTRLKGFEKSAAREMLQQTLSHGIAYHNGDLSLEYRKLLEEGFQSGEIKLLFATGTLGQGLNLAARNTLIVPEVYRFSAKTGNFISQSIPLFQLENQGGRAGRLGFSDPFGRMILVAESEHEQTMLWTRYIAPPADLRQGRINGLPYEPVQSSLNRQSWEKSILKLASLYKNIRIEDICNFFDCTLLARLKGLEEFAEGQPLYRKIQDALKHLSHQDYLLISHEGNIQVTNAGYLCAATGLEPASFDWMKRWVSRFDGKQVDKMEVLLMLSFTPDALRTRVPLKEGEIKSRFMVSLLLKKAYDLSIDENRILKPVMDIPTLPLKELLTAVKKNLALLDWLSEKETAEVEQQHNLFAGTLKTIGEEYAWLVRAFAELGALRGWSWENLSWYETLACRLENGLMEKGLHLARIPVEGFSRNAIHLLAKEGYETVSQLREAPAGELERILSFPLSFKLREWLKPATEKKEIPLTFSKEMVADRMELTGKAAKRRTLLVLNGKELEIPNSTYLVLLKLARALKGTEPSSQPGGWVYRDELDPSDHWRSISRLRVLLEPFQADPHESILENDGCGYYRLRLHPDNLIIREENHLVHWNCLFHPPANSHSESKEAPGYSLPDKIPA
jgi:helicase